MTSCELGVPVYSGYVLVLSGTCTGLSMVCVVMLCLCGWRLVSCVGVAGYFVFLVLALCHSDLLCAWGTYLY